MWCRRIGTTPLVEYGTLRPIGERFLLALFSTPTIQQLLQCNHVVGGMLSFPLPSSFRERSSNMGPDVLFSVKLERQSAIL